MAERAPRSPGLGDHKTLSEETAHDVEQSPEHSRVPIPDDDDDDGAGSSRNGDDPIERVEAVYRKLDLRIIPGLLTPPSSLLPPSAAYLTSKTDQTLKPRIQPSGSCTSSAPPSAPTSASRRP